MGDDGHWGIRVSAIGRQIIKKEKREGKNEEEEEPALSEPRSSEEQKGGASISSSPIQHFLHCPLVRGG